MMILNPMKIKQLHTMPISSKYTEIIFIINILAIEGRKMKLSFNLSNSLRLVGYLTSDHTLKVKASHIKLPFELF